MKSIDVLRQLIREELTKVIRKELPKLLEEHNSKGSNILYSQDFTKEKDSAPALVEHLFQPKQRNTVSDEGPLTIAEILKTTPPLRENANNILGMQDDQLHESDSIYNEITVGHDHRPIDMNNKTVRGVMNNINKDYSSLMKKILKK